MVIDPGHIEPGARSFRSALSASGPPLTSTTRRRTRTLTKPYPNVCFSQPAAGPQPRDQQSGRGQRTRRTVDLPASTHRALDIWQREAADSLGVARVTGQEVLAALIDQLLVDPKLTAQIVRAIESRR